MLVPTCPLRLHADPCHQEFNHVPLRLYIVAALNFLKAIPESGAERRGFVVVGFERLGQILLGTERPQRGPQCSSLLLYSVQLAFGIAERRASSTEQRHDTLALRSLLGQRLLEPVPFS